MEICFLAFIPQYNTHIWHVFFLIVKYEKFQRNETMQHVAAKTGTQHIVEKSICPNWGGVRRRRRLMSGFGGGMVEHEQVWEREGGEGQLAYCNL